MKRKSKINWQTVKFAIRFLATILGYIFMTVIIILFIKWYVQYKGWL